MGADATVDVKVSDGGMRHGTYTIYSVSGTIPEQGITTTNLNHLGKLNTAQRRRIRYNTKFIEIIYDSDLSMLENKEWLSTEAAMLKRKREAIMADYPNAICLIFLKSAKTITINRKINKLFIKLQKAAGFTFIKVFMKYEKDALEDLEIFLNLLAPNTHLLPMLDESLLSQTFSRLYEKCLRKQLPIVGFLGRELSDKNPTINDNYRYIRGRPKDKVIRLVSDIDKKQHGIVKSYIYKWLGYDVFIWKTRIGSYSTSDDLEVVRNRHYVKLSENPDIVCPITGGRIVDTVEDFRRREQETIPLSIKSILEVIEDIHGLSQKMTEKQLEEMISAEISVLTKPASEIPQNKRLSSYL